MTRVLIVDDELSVRETFQAFLERDGYGVVVASDFVEAESFLSSSSPEGRVDVVVADVVLLRIEQVRRIDEDIPLIVTAGEPDVSIAAEVMRLGGYDYVVKPVTQEALNRIVGRAVEKKRLLDDKRRLEAQNQTYRAELEQSVSLVAELEQRNRELATVIEIGRDVSATLDLIKVLKRLTQRAAQICGAYRCTVFMVAPDEETVIPLMSRFSEDRVDPRLWCLFRDARYPVAVSQVPELQKIIGEQYPLFISDASTSSLPAHWIESFDLKRLLGVPIISKEQVVGVMWFDHVEEGKGFSARQVDLAIAIAAQAAVAIENARLFAETDRRLSEARLIQEVMLAATSTLDFDLVLERTVKALHRALKIDRLGFLMPSERGTMLVSHPSLVGFSGSVLRIPVKGSWVGQTYKIGQPVLVQDTTQQHGYFDQSPDVRSALAVPVRVGGRIVAVLHAESPQKSAFGEDELHLFITIAGQLGVALDSARLYQKLEAQAAKLVQANEELKKINRLRTELVQNVGHELRTPLGLVRGYVELLLAGELGDLADSQREVLEVVSARAITLERMIHNLTVLQVVPRDAIVLTPVSLAEAVRHALADFRISAQKANVVFQDELPSTLPLVLGNLERLKLVFCHLVDNAIKFSPNGGTVTARAWTDWEMVYVSISDEGIGIPTEHRERIFERFYQIDGSASRRFGGMGIGLALVWEIIEVHAGTVVVESEPGKGSTFTIALLRADKVRA
jgi:signal transduction histidine kinase/FixJ family two-component response regulator